MEKIQLEEYRCPCGKLLFKGLIVVSLVEVKCKRCSEISIFGDIKNSKSPFSFLISIDQEGKITDLCKGTEMMLGLTRDQLIGTSIGQVSPMILDKFVSAKEHAENYEIKDNAFLVRNGVEIPAESYCITPKESPFSYIFSRLRQA